MIASLRIAVVAGVLASCGARAVPTFPSNFATVRLAGSKILAADGAPYTGTLVARDAEIAAVAHAVLPDTPFDKAPGKQLAGLILVLPVRDGVAEGRAAIRIDLAAPNLDRELARRIDLPRMARELVGTVVIAEATFAHGTLDGPAVAYGPGGRPVIEAAFRAGRPHGPAREYFPGTAQVQRELAFDAGARSGRERAFYADGAVEREAAYQDGELQGEVVEYFANHRVRARGTYDHGRRVGTHRTWFPTGQLHTEVVAGAEPQMTEWYSNGQVKLDAHGQHPPDGVVEEFHHGGALRSRTHYANGVQDGAFDVFYADGTKWEAGAYAAGRQVGMHHKWWKNGRLALEATYVDGALHGPYQRWYANGTLWESVVYDRGVRVGHYQKWWKNGAVAYDSTYAQGKLDGDARQFYDNGAKWAFARYDHGRAVGTHQRWFPDGKLGYTVDHDARGRQHGPFRRWYADGKPRLEATYVDGQLDGEFKNYLADGTVYEVATYRRGVKVTTTRPLPPSPP